MTVIAMTGAAGYIAGRVVRALEESPLCTRLIGVDLKPPLVTSRKLDFYRRDVRDPELPRFFQEQGVSIIIHFAFVLNPIHNLDEMHSVNIAGTRNVLEAAKLCGARQLLATSSTSAYGALPDNPARLREEMPLRAAPSFQYAKDKREMDLLLQEFARQNSDIAVCIFRPCIVMGPNLDNFISKGMTLPLNIVVEGQNPEMQFVHEDDVARAALLALERDARGIYNIVGGGTIRLEEAWELKGQGFRVDWPAWAAYNLVRLAWTLHLPGMDSPPAALDFFRWQWVADGEKARRELGFEPQYSSWQLWQDYLQWIKAHPKRGPVGKWLEKRRQSAEPAGS